MPRSQSVVDESSNVVASPSRPLLTFFLLVVGIIGGMKSKGMETDSDIAARKQSLCKFGYEP